MDKHLAPDHFIGCLFSDPRDAARTADYHIDYTILKEWAQNQYNILKERGLTDAEKLELPHCFYEYSIDTSDMLHISYYYNGEYYQCDLPTLINRTINRPKLKSFMIPAFSVPAHYYHATLNMYVSHNHPFDKPTVPANHYTILKSIKIQAEKLGHSVQTDEDWTFSSYHLTIVEIK